MATKKKRSPPAAAPGANPARAGRYVALLRGVSPMNLRMPDLRLCLEAAGYTHVVTVRSSGNVVFDVPSATTTAALERRLEEVLAAGLDRGFPVIVRSVAHLAALLHADAFAAHALPANAKRVVTFLRAPPTARLVLPVSSDNAWILALHGADLFSAYVPGDKGPVFMSLIEKTFGKDVTTRTWDTIRIAAGA